MDDVTKQTVEMTEEELRDFNTFKQKRDKEQAVERAKRDREAYRVLVDETIESSVPDLLALSDVIKRTKGSVMDNFRTVIDMKSDVMKLTKDEQRSHTFTHSKGDKRITLGVYVTDGYLDTVEDGIVIVKEYIEGLASDAKTKSLVSMVMRLLARDAKGTLKASRVVQLRKVAEESGDDRFMEGVRIIEESYIPAISKQFIRTEVKDRNGMWKAVPLGMTEADSEKPIEGNR